MFYLILILLVFLGVVIATNPNGGYLKQGSFALMVLAILNGLLLFRLGDTGSGKAIYLGIFEVTYEGVELLFYASILIALLSLIIYLYVSGKKM